MKIQQDKVYLSDGLGWVIHVSDYKNRRPSDWIGHAVCLKSECRVKLEFGDQREAKCIKCGGVYKIGKDYEQLRGEVGLKYDGSKLWGAEVINLDLDPTKIAAEDSDDKYWIQVRLGQKNGKRTAVAYIGEKMQNQTKQNYTQLFIDLDDEQLRFDKGNMHPMKLLSRLEVNFQNTDQEVISHKK